MASLFERLTKAFKPETPSASPVLLRAAKTQAPYITAIRNGYQFGGQKPGVKMLRHFADSCEFVRMAINRRKHQIAQAPWKIVRQDDPKADADPRVEKQIKDLLRNVNPKHESFRSLLDQVLEDFCIIDAGCIEKEKTLGGDIVALYAVDGGTIRVIPEWQGEDPMAPRYEQWINSRKVASLRNDELIYLMANPRTYSAIGWSPVETLVRTIEAELYGEEYSFEQLKQTAPAGMLYLGPGLTTDQVDAYREYYESEIAGTKSLAIFGGGISADGKAQTGPSFTPFQPNNTESQLMDYKKWLAIKIAGVFEMDLLAFNLTEGVNRSTGKTLQTSTDEGHKSMSKLVAEFLTRELVEEIDERHAFEFGDINDRDEVAQAEVDAVRMTSGVTFPNEIRARDGLDPVPWGDVPYVAGSTTVLPTGDLADPNDPAQNPNHPSNKPAPVIADGTEGNQKADKGEAGKKSLPFARGGTSRRTLEPRPDFLLS